MNVSYQLATTEKSQITSQLSTSFLLGMLLHGVSGDTLKEIYKVFNLDINNKDIFLNEMLCLYNDLNKSETVKIHNVILSKIELKKDYLKNIKQFGHHEHLPSNMSSIELMDKINLLVKTHTNGMIDKIVKQSEIENAILILINTIYFYSNWKTKFESRHTTKKIFYGLSGKRNEHIMALSEKKFKYIENNTYQMLSMPYENEKFTFVVVLPNDKLSGPVYLNLEDLIKSLSKSTLEKVNVDFPKFTQETEIDLIPVLKNMGVNKLFTDADTDNMFHHKMPTFISLLKQKAKIIVNETGTEASVVTIAAIKLKCAKQIHTKVYDFIADHPFEYYVMYNENQVIFEGTFV